MQPLKLSFLTWICKDPTYWLAANNKTYNVIMKLTVVVNMNIVQHGGGESHKVTLVAHLQKSRKVSKCLCALCFIIFTQTA